MPNVKSVAVVGLGYVGLSLCRLLSRSGLDVEGIDTNQEKVRQLNSGQSPISDVTDEDVQEMLSAHFRADIRVGAVQGWDAVILTLPTPLDRGGTPDLAPLLRGVDSIAPLLKDQTLVIVESTVAPGTTEGKIRPCIEAHGKTFGSDFLLAFSPERVDPGSSHGLASIPKIVSGLDDRSRERAADLYRVAGFDVVEAWSTRDAEFAKLLENTYRAVNIALINELAEASAPLGVDIGEAIGLASSKPFGFQPFHPSAGVGGHCIPIDPVYLQAALFESGASSEVLHAAIAANRLHPERVATRLRMILPSSPPRGSKRRVLLLGMTYKPDVDDFREAPGLKLAQNLAKRGYEVCYHDPFLTRPIPNLAGTGTWVGSIGEISSFSATLVVQEHRAYDQLISENKDTPYFFSVGANGPHSRSLWSRDAQIHFVRSQTC